MSPTAPQPHDDTSGNHSAPHANHRTAPGPGEAPSKSYVEALSRVYGSRGGGRSRVSESAVALSGPYERADGFSAYLQAFGITTVQVDNDKRRGNAEHDILRDDLLRDDFFQSLIRCVAMGEFLCILAAPPCSTVQRQPLLPQ